MLADLGCVVNSALEASPLTSVQPKASWFYAADAECFRSQSQHGLMAAWSLKHLSPN